MKLSMYLSVLFFITPLFLFSQKVTNYLGLKEISTPSPNHKLLFYCREVNNLDKQRDFSWESGILLTSTNDTLAVKAEIDWKKDEIFIFHNEKVYILFQEKVKAIALGDKLYICTLTPENGQLFPSYFELLAEGETNLLKKPDNLFYYKKKNQAATALKRNKKYLNKVLENKNISEYISRHKLNPKNETDLIRIFEFSNRG